MRMVAAAGVEEGCELRCGGCRVVEHYVVEGGGMSNKFGRIRIRKPVRSRPQGSDLASDHHLGIGLSIPSGTIDGASRVWQFPQTYQ